jgi:hypothetical protein
MTTTTHSSTPVRRVVTLLAALAAVAALGGCATSGVGNPELTGTLSYQAQPTSGFAIASPGAGRAPLHGPSTDIHSFGTSWRDDAFSALAGDDRPGLSRTLRVIAWHCGGQVPDDVMAALAGRSYDGDPSPCRDDAVAAVLDLHDGKVSAAERRHDRGKGLGLLAGAVACAVAPPVGCVALTIGGAAGGLATAPRRSGS